MSHVWEQPSDRDLQVVETQLGRRPGGVIGVAARCRFGRPQVIVSAPLRVRGKSVDTLPDHITPDQVAVFPTLYWLTCPMLREAIGRLESTGWIARIKAELQEDEAAKDELEAAHVRTARIRRGLLPRSTLDRLARDFPGQYRVLTQSGVAGMRDLNDDELGVKCLHAHFADYLAEQKNPIGRRVWALLTKGGVDPRGWGACFAECKVACPDREDTLGAPQAVIDVGSNSVRLLVAQLKHGTWEPLAAECISTRLAQGLGDQGELGIAAINRTVRAVDKLRKRAAEFQIQDPFAIGTSALREAENNATFLIRAWEKAGVSVRVVTGDEEGQLSFLGATRCLGIPADDNVLLCDVGGGSTELIVGRGGGDVTGVISLPLGAVRLYTEVENGRSLEECLLELRRSVEQSRETLQTRALFEDEPGVVVAVGGTATTLAALDQEMVDYDPGKVNGYRLSQERLQDWTMRLTTMGLGQRMSLAGMPQGRADIIPFGLAILTTVINVWEACVASEIIVSDSDLLQGVLVSFQETMPWRVH